MSVGPAGVVGRGASFLAALGGQVKRASLAPLTSVRVVFDPFHPAAANCRQFVYHLSAARVRNTNSNCRIKTEVVCDRREPFVSCTLAPEYAERFGAKTVDFKANQLTYLELFQLYNKYITPLAKDSKKTEKLDASTKKTLKKK